MKKFFTLTAVALMATSINAQEVLDVTSDEVKPIIEAAITNPTVLNNPLFILVPQDEKVFPAGTFINNDYESVVGGTSIGLKNYSWEASTANMTVKANSTLNADSNDDTESFRFNIAKEKEDGTYDGTIALVKDGCDPQFLGYVNPKTGNPSPAYKEFYEWPAKKTTDEEGKEVEMLDEQGNYISDTDGEPIHRVLDPVWAPGNGDLPAKGCYYEFTAKTDGVLKIAIFLNKNLASNKLYIVDESTQAEGYKALTGDKLTIKGFRQGNLFETESDRGTTSLVDWTLNDEFLLTTANIDNGGTNRPFYGYVSFEVKANTTYMALTPKNQLGLFGYEFTPSTGTGINVVKSAEKADAAVYNMAGQRVDAAYKGLVIKNGVKRIQK